MTRRNAGRLRVRAEGLALHHAHEKLRDIAAALANYFASGVFELCAKLGPILWQFPPNFRYERERMARLFDLLPHDTNAALRLARKRDARMKGRARLAIDEQHRLRHAVEIRHESFRDASFADLLREHGIALVIAESAQRWPMMTDITADFVYMRLHGDKELYKSGYSNRALERWAQRISAWHRGGSSQPRAVYCYFDNTDVKLRAPVDAQSLMRKLGLQPRRPGLNEFLRTRGGVDPQPQPGSRKSNCEALHGDDGAEIPYSSAPTGRRNSHP